MGLAAPSSHWVIKDALAGVIRAMVRRRSRSYGRCAMRPAVIRLIS
jgi:hypothetical protein